MVLISATAADEYAEPLSGGPPACVTAPFGNQIRNVRELIERPLTAAPQALPA